MRIQASARRHGVSDEAIRHVVAHAVRMTDVDDGVFLIGADASGHLLEVVARSTEEGEDLFHAVSLRPTNARRYLR